MPEKEKIVICFDATEYDNFEMCNFRWHAFHNLHMRPKQTESHFELGTLLHYFEELYYKEKMVTQSVPQDKLEQIIEKGRLESLKYEMNVEEVGATVYQFREYVRYYADENIIPLHVEEPFMVKIYEDEDIIVYISGKPDLIFRYAGTKDIAVMDHKRMTRNTNYSPLRNQFQFYATAIGTDTVIVNKIGFQKTLEPKERFLRTPFVYPKEILEEWKRDVIFRAKEMVIAQQFQHFQRNRTSCEKWSGCYLQRYCYTRPSARDFLIGKEYLIADKPWDASASLENETKETK